MATHAREQREQNHGVIRLKSDLMSNPYSSPRAISTERVATASRPASYAAPAIIAIIAVVLLSCIAMIDAAYAVGRWGALGIAWYISPCVNLGFIAISLCCIPLVRRLFPFASMRYYVVTAILAPVLSSVTVYFSLMFMDLHGC